MVTVSYLNGWGKKMLYISIGMQMSNRKSKGDLCGLLERGPVLLLLLAVGIVNGCSGKQQPADDIAQGYDQLVIQPPVAQGNFSAKEHTCRYYKHVDYCVLVS